MERRPHNDKRKTPASCLVGAFLAIGLSINQTVACEFYKLPNGDGRSIVFRLTAASQLAFTKPIVLTVSSTVL